MLTKKQFIKILDYIIKEEDKQEKFSQALKEYAPSDFTDFSKPDITTFLVEILEDLMDDKPYSKYDDSTISWWLWGCPDRGRCENDDSCTIWLGEPDDPETEKFIIRTPEDLYAFLVVSHGKAPSEESIQMAIKAQDTGVKFALKIIKDIKNKNFETHNKGWSERDAEMEYLLQKITNEYLFKAGTNRDLNLDEDLHIISILEES